MNKEKETVIKENKMGTMPINKLIINMSLPLITSMFVQAFYNIVDSLFVSRINEEALTAVSMSFPAQNLMISAGTGVGVGITALIARYLGAKDEKGVTKVVHNGIFLGILNSILFVIFGIFFTKFYFQFQKASGIIEEYGIQYLSLCSIFAFSIIMEITFERMLIASGKNLLYHDYPKYWSNYKYYIRSNFYFWTSRISKNGNSRSSRCNYFRTDSFNVYGIILQY